MKNLTPKIAKYIKNHRLSLRRTQKDMAQAAGISLMTLRRAESGEVISLETLIALMDVFAEAVKREVDWDGELWVEWRLLQLRLG